MIRLAIAALAVGLFVALTLGLAVDNIGHATGDKITICHIPPGNPANTHSITISVNAWPAHQAHGDFIMEEGNTSCPFIPTSTATPLSTPTPTVTPFPTGTATSTPTAPPASTPRPTSTFTATATPTIPTPTTSPLRHATPTSITPTATPTSEALASSVAQTPQSVASLPATGGQP